MAGQSQMSRHYRPQLDLRDTQGQPRRILIDCTRTVLSGLRTGVQRVVRSLVREGAQLGRERGQAITGVVLGATGFEEYCPGHDSEAHSLPPVLRDNVLHYLPRAYVRGAEWLVRYSRSAKLKRVLLPRPGHLGVYRPAVWLVEQAQKAAGRDPRKRNSMDLGRGDMLVLADGYWAKLEILECARELRAKGVFVVVVIHDLIPITHPHTVPPRFLGHFRKYIKAALMTADLVIAVSQTVCDELREKLADLFPELSCIPPVEAFRNGADFGQAAGDVRDELTRLFSDGTRQPNPYLTVSTFDPRKNHDFTLSAFEHLWRQGIDARITFVGARGWNCEALLRTIHHHPELGKRLHVFHDLSDAELFHCYQHARGVISSSVIEGFSLPVVEGLWHGRKTFASDTPIHREVGEHHATYFRLDSPHRLASAVAQWEREIVAGASIDQCRVKPMSWRESTSLLLERATAAFAARQLSGKPVAKVA